MNKLATDKPIAWFEKNLIATVPLRYAGAMRRVYPGFLQLMAFMSMNLDRHIDALPRSLRATSSTTTTEKAEATRSFYEEYFAVADLPAEFYLETVQQVFQDYALATGRARRGAAARRSAAIRRTALLTDRRRARRHLLPRARRLLRTTFAPGLRPYMKTHYVQPGVGHYGVFSGRRWSNHIYPVVRDMIHVSQ